MIVVIEVRCDNPACPASNGPWQQVRLQLVATNIVARPTLLCSQCRCVVAEWKPEGSCESAS